jgi:hypothetical protein
VSKSPVTPVQTAQPQKPPFAIGMAARQLAQAASVDTLAAVVGAPKSSSYGFVGSSSRQGTAFRAGKQLFELELWLAAGDRERAGLAGERLVPLLRSLGGNAVTAPLDDLLRQLDNNAPLDRKGDVVSQLEALLKSADKGMVRLGGWAAAARVAAGVGNDPYFAGNPPRHLLDELDGNLSPATREALKTLDKTKTGSNPEQVRRLLDELDNAI